jgi:mannosyl-3-phosphoglycerate phosphatase
MEGTLLGRETFDAGSNQALLQRLDASGVPVIPVTVMTFAEILPVARSLGIRGPMVIEAGGAVVRLVDGAWVTEACGVAGDALLDAILEIEDRSGAQLAVYSVLDERDAAMLSGRRGAMLAGSTQRLFSEPFVIERGDIHAVEDAAAAIGFTVRRGQRLLYLCRASDEGSTFERVRDELRIDLTIGAGGSPIDLGFLSRVDIPIIIPKANGVPDAEVLAAVPHARIAPAPAPKGWGAAVGAILREIGTRAGSARAKR